MSSEKARRWALKGADAPSNPPGEPFTRLFDGPNLPPEQEVEVAEVSALRAEWEEELLSDVALKAAQERLVDFADVFLHEGVIRDATEAALAAIKEERDCG